MRVYIQTVIQLENARWKPLSKLVASTIEHEESLPRMLSSRSHDGIDYTRRIHRKKLQSLDDLMRL